MDLVSMLTGKWFTRLVLVSCIACSVAAYFVFKNMEFMVHGQLYYYGLIFSPEWADGYRVFTWLIFLFLSVPMALSGLALASTFVKVEKIPKKTPPRVNKVRHLGLQKSRPIQNSSVHKSRPAQQTRQPQAPNKKTIKENDNGNCLGISCPECKKVFGRALVMLDFRGGSNRMVSVCPYCNHVIGYTDEEKDEDDVFMVGIPDKKIVH
jgi:hypothetical protein